MLDPDNQNRSKNALTHGVYSNEILLPGESEEDFMELYKALKSELNPASPLEQEAVLDLTCLHWQKRRAIHAAKLKFRRTQNRVEMTAFDRMELRESVWNFKDKMQKVVESVNELSSTISVSPEALRKIKDKTDGCMFFVNEMKRCSSFFNEVEKVCDLPKEEDVIYSYEPADLEQVVKVEALIDTRIEKVLARLTRIKEFGRLYGQKEVASG